MKEVFATPIATIVLGYTLALQSFLDGGFLGKKRERPTATKYAPNSNGMSAPNIRINQQAEELGNFCRLPGNCPPDLFAALV